jgi:hypothetical protein
MEVSAALAVVRSNSHQDRDNRAQIPSRLGLCAELAIMSGISRARATPTAVIASSGEKLNGLDISHREQ